MVMVQTVAALMAAIASARGGETIALAPGNYGEVEISGRAFRTPVTIVSAGKGRPAHLDRLLINKSSGLRFARLDIGRGVRPGEIMSGWNALVRVGGSKDIVIDRVSLHGSLDGDPTNDHLGFYAADCAGLTLSNSELQQLAAGLGIDRTSGVKIIGNELHDIQGDGMDFAQVNTVLIEGNRLRNFFFQPGQHPDGIQFWTARTKAPSTDIVIRNNIIRQGRGNGLQGIFITDQTNMMPYRNIVIENNLVQTTFDNGISVMNADNVVIRNNSALPMKAQRVTARIWMNRVSNGTLENNVAGSFNLKDNPGLKRGKSIDLSSEGRKLSKILSSDPEAPVADVTFEGVGYRAGQAER